jgi:hypothetical protein
VRQRAKLTGSTRNVGKNACFTLLLATAALVMLVACGGGSTFNVQNPPPPASQGLMIAFQPAPPTSLPISGTAQATAVVQNDGSNAGVDWSLSCTQPGRCGSLSSLHTPSDQAVTYSPPSSMLGNSQTVNLVAYATADHSKNVQNAITITAYGSILAGTYVIGTSGSDVFGQPYQRAGVITLDGAGAILPGEQTVNSSNPNTGLISSVADAITGGSYFVGGDGRGELVLNTNDPNIGQNGIETFSLVVLSPSHVLLSKLDDPNFGGASNETSVGTLDLQTSTNSLTPSGGYAFVARGTDMNFASIALGGVLNLDSPTAISGAGSAFDVTNPNNYGAGVVVPSATVSGTVSSPDTFGAFQIAVVTDFASRVQFTAYPIDATHAKLIESDGSFGFTFGDAYSQGAATGTYHGRAKFNGDYAFGIQGRDLGGVNASLAAAGLFSATGTGTLTSGYLDESQVDGSVQIDGSFQAAYAVGPGSDPSVTNDPAGTGRYYIPASNFNFANPIFGSGPTWVFYMTTPGGPILMLDADIEPSLSSGLFGGGVGTGIAYPVVSGASFSGLYGTVWTQDSQGATTDVVGVLTVSNNAFSGVLDFNGGTGPQKDDTSLTGSFQPGPVANRLHGPMSDNFFTTASGTTSLRMAFYPIDSTQGFVVEHDVADSTGLLDSGTTTFGFYAARTPVCQGCP